MSNYIFEIRLGPICDHYSNDINQLSAYHIMRQPAERQGTEYIPWVLDHIHNTSKEYTTYLFFYTAVDVIKQN